MKRIQTNTYTLLLPRQKSCTFSIASGIVIFFAEKGHFTSSISGLTFDISNMSASPGF